MYRKDRQINKNSTDILISNLDRKYICTYTYILPFILMITFDYYIVNQMTDRKINRKNKRNIQNMDRKIIRKMDR